MPRIMFLDGDGNKVTESETDFPKREIYITCIFASAKSVFAAIKAESVTK